MNDPKILRLSLIEAFLFSLMVGIGETYFTAFALKKGMSETLSGFVSTLPLVLGALLQILTPYILKNISSPKKWAFIMAFLQAFLFLIFALFAFFDAQMTEAFFILCSIYFALTFSGGLAWNLWMTEVISERNSTEFFSFRVRVSQFGILTGLAFGGIFLHLSDKSIEIFSVLFVIAFACRLFSAFFLYKTPENRDISQTKYLKLPTSIISDFFKSRERIVFFGFMFIFYTVIYISSPFINPFFLKKLQLSYFHYMLGIASLLACKGIAAHFAHRLIETHGLKKVFFIGALGLSPLPAFWPINQSIFFILFLQGLSGAFWGIFEVCLTVMFFNHLSKIEKIGTLAVHNFFNSFALFLGTFIGGLFLHNGREELGIYFTIFIFSGVVRVLIVLLFYYLVRNKEHLLNYTKKDKEINPHPTFSKTVKI